MMNRTNKILLVLVTVFVLVLAMFLVWQSFAKPSYYAVYLRTGDLYFGQLNRFPSLGLSHVYTLQVNSQNQTNPITIQKFTNIFWGPSDYLKLYSDQIVWINRLNPESQLVKLVTENPELSVTGAENLPVESAPAAEASNVEEIEEQETATSSETTPLE